MGIWDTYNARIEAVGEDVRTSILKREVRYLNNRVRNTLSYKKVEIEGEEREVSIINSDNMNEKTMISMVGEDFDLGSLVSFNDTQWLITEKDFNNDLYTKVKLEQCNYLLKWIDENAVIHEQWSIVTDGTKLSRFPERYSLVWWKHQAKRTSLTAGTSLEPSNQNRTANSRKWQRFKDWMDWTISNQASNRRRFNDYLHRESRLRPKWEAPKA